MIKIITIIGTRPEIIKLSEVIKLFNKDLRNIKKRKLNPNIKSYWHISEEDEDIKFDKQY